MSVKVHFLHSHQDYFPENLGASSEEQGERFQQDKKVMVKRFQGKRNAGMIADYCSGLIPECSRSLVFVNQKEGNYCRKIVFNGSIFSFVLSIFLYLLLSMCFCIHSFTFK